MICYGGDKKECTQLLLYHCLIQVKLRKNEIVVIVVVLFEPDVDENQAKSEAEL